MMARSAQHEPEVDVIGHRLRRLLVPLWAFGLVAVPIMLWQGWGSATDENTFYVANLVFWIFPFLDPPGSTAAANITGGLWYIRAALWFVLLTPLMRAALRRNAPLAMIFPLVFVGLDAWLGWDLSSGGGTGPALIDFCTFATCWMLGMAYRDGTLKRLHPILLVLIAAAAIAGGGAWLWLRARDLDLDSVPLAQALISAGAVILVLVVSPLMAWLDRVPLLGALLGTIAARALTIYLCYPVVIAVTPLVVTRLGLGGGVPTAAATGVALMLVAVLAFGWVEDLAARRPLRILPRPARLAGDQPSGAQPPGLHAPQLPPAMAERRAPAMAERRAPAMAGRQAVAVAERRPPDGAWRRPSAPPPPYPGAPASSYPRSAPAPAAPRPGSGHPRAQHPQAPARRPGQTSPGLPPQPPQAPQPLQPTPPPVPRPRHPTPPPPPRPPTPVPAPGNGSPPAGGRPPNQRSGRPR